MTKPATEWIDAAARKLGEFRRSTLTTLVGLADRHGAVPVDDLPTKLGLTRGAVDTLYGELNRHGLATATPETLTLCGLVAAEPTKTSRSTGTRGSERTIPVPQVPTRSPHSQAEHMTAIRRSKRLKDSPGSHHLALCMHLIIGAKTKGAFTSAKVPLSVSLLMDETGMSRRTVENHLKTVVAAGFFRRVDNGKGGKGGQNTATYTPVVPDYG